MSFSNVRPQTRSQAAAASANNNNMSAAAAAQPDLAAVLAALAQAQQQAADIQQQAALQAAEDRQRLHEALEQLAAHQAKTATIQQSQHVQQTAASKMSLARATAGAAPFFFGKTNNIEVHRWIIAMERWFDTAEVVDEAERLKIAASQFRDSAQSWWNAEKQSGRVAANYTTWSLFTAAAKKQFLPMEVDRWARNEVRSLVSKANADVLDYSAKYNELNQLIETREEIDRMLEYINGLPEEYRVKAIEKKHTKLVDAVESATTIYNARQANRSQMRGAASLQHMDASSDYAFDTQSTSSSSTSSSSAAGMNSLYSQSPGGPQQVSSLEEQVSMLAAMFTQQFGRGGSRGGYNSNRQGRSRGRGGNENASGARSRSTSWVRPVLSPEVYSKRRGENLCYQCGAADHIIRDCPQKKDKKKEEEKK
jgi:hypothetical protein